MIDKTDQTRRDLTEAVHLMRHEHPTLWAPVYECGCESWVDVMLGNYDDIVNERESTAQPAPDPLGPDDHGHTGRLWCDPCVGHGVMLEQGIHRCANPVSSGNGIAPDPLREAALALLNWYDTTHGNEFGHDHHCPVPWDDNPHTQTPDDRCTCGWSAFLRADDKRAALAAPALRSAVVGPPITGAALVERIREDRLTSTPAPDPLREPLYTAIEVREHGERIARAYKAEIAALAQPAPDPLREAALALIAATDTLSEWDEHHAYVVNSARDQLDHDVDRAWDALRAALEAKP